MTKTLDKLNNCIKSKQALKLFNYNPLVPDRA